MSQDQRSGQQRYFLQGIIKTHKALGAGLGIVVFIVCLSGAVALFDSELHTWTNAQLSHTNTPASAEFSDWPLDKIAEQAIARHSGEGLLDIEVLIIGKANPWQKYLTSWTHTEHDEAWHIDQWHGQTGEHIAQQPDGVNHLLAEIHTDLWLPNPYGRYLVGFAGVVLMLMALGGIFAHRHWRREFHTLKHNRGERRLWGDLHKLVGLWALPFHMIIGFTGALIGLLGLLLLLIAFVAYQGDTQAAVDEIFGQDPKPAEEIVALPPLGPFIEKAKADMKPGFKPSSINIVYPRDKHGFVLVSGPYGNTLSIDSSAKYRFDNGEIIMLQDYVYRQFVLRLYSATVPLHYATFGGILMKLLYFVLALGTSFMCASGLYLWLRRRKQIDWKTKLTVFGLGAYPLATALALASAVASKWLPGLGAMAFSLPTASFLLGLLISLALCLTMRELKRSLGLFLKLSAWPLLALALIDSGASVWRPDWAAEAWGSNLLIALCALLLLLAAKALATAPGSND